MNFFYRLGHLSLLLLSLNTQTIAQESPSKKTFNWLSITGYGQFRYNDLALTNSEIRCDQCDKSIGTDQGIYVRRLRFTVETKITPRLKFKIQPDISGLLENSDAVRLRDLYFEYNFGKNKEITVKAGQTRVAYGFENLQSSRERAIFDRNDGVNSAFINERDWGLFAQYTPSNLKPLFEAQKKNNLKGPGDYGFINVAVFQGQSTLKDYNNNKHISARIAYPFQMRNQLFEASFQAYTGKYTMLEDNLTKGVQLRTDSTYTDSRVGAAFAMFPQPLGFQAEYNLGQGPEFDPSTGSIKQKTLSGGYVMLNYKIPTKKFSFFPYVRAQYYDGAKKHERDARRYLVKEFDAGMEWIIRKNIEFTASYLTTNRTFEDFKLPQNKQVGSMVRLQFQIGF